MTTFTTRRFALTGLFVATLVACLAGASCNGTTGGALITFSAYAAGAAGADKPFTTYDATNHPAYSVQLTHASMYIGALYFDESPPSTGFDTPVCITPDIYAAQVPAGLQIDLLSATPQAFSQQGDGSSNTALSWDIWLTNGDVNATSNGGAHILEIQGVATRLADQKPFSFATIVTINGVVSGAGARLANASTPGLPGQYPICKERILAIDLPGGLPFFQGGSLQVTVDPRQWFIISNIDFANGLEPWDSEDCQADPGSTTTYENGETCDAQGQCAGGFVCNAADNNCIAAFCIPDTNYPSDTTVSAAPNFFDAIEGGGAAAYGVTYSR